MATNNEKEVYPTHNEEKLVVAERFIRTLKNKIYKYVISISKYVYVNKLDDKVNKYYMHIIAYYICIS